MSFHTSVRLVIAALAIAAAAPFARPSLGAQSVVKNVTTTVTVNPVTTFVSATPFTRLSLAVNGVTYIYFATTVTTTANTPYQIQVRLTTAYQYPPVQARLWDGTGTYVDITTTTSAIAAKGVPRSPETDDVRFRVALPKGQTQSSLPAPQITYTIIPQ